ncbi:hypothetical protein B0H11DRAFT_1905307 [Mycena galericulata]|nr:hypothetical protein B0H11DRAFT_1905307 [Mycena galericulata]
MAVYEDKPVDRQAGRSAAAQPKRPAPRVDQVASNKLEIAKDLSREQCGGKQAKIGAFFQVETPEEREKMRPRELETFRVTKEVREAEEQQRKYKAKLKAPLLHYIIKEILDIRCLQLEIVDNLLGPNTQVHGGVLQWWPKIMQHVIFENVWPVALQGRDILFRSKCMKGSRMYVAFAYKKI